MEILSIIFISLMSAVAYNLNYRIIQGKTTFDNKSEIRKVVLSTFILFLCFMSTLLISADYDIVIYILPMLNLVMLFAILWVTYNEKPNFLVVCMAYTISVAIATVSVFIVSFVEAFLFYDIIEIPYIVFDIFSIPAFIIAYQFVKKKDVLKNVEKTDKQPSRFALPIGVALVTIPTLLRIVMIDFTSDLLWMPVLCIAVPVFSMIIAFRLKRRFIEAAGA
jgi:hypothetical protein